MATRVTQSGFTIWFAPQPERNARARARFAFRCLSISNEARPGHAAVGFFHFTSFFI